MKLSMFTTMRTPTLLLFTGAIAAAGCADDPSDSDHPATSCDGGVVVDPPEPPPPPPPPPPTPDGGVPTGELACDQLLQPILPPMSDGQTLTNGELRRLCCYLPEHFPRVTLSSTNPENVATFDALFANAPSLASLVPQLSFCDPAIALATPSLPSTFTVADVKQEVWEAEQQAIQGTPIAAYLSGVPLEQVVHIGDVNSDSTDLEADGGSTARVITAPTDPGAPEIGVAANPAYISVGLAAIYYGYMIFRAATLQGGGALAGEMAQPNAGAMMVLNNLNIMAIQPANANMQAAQFLQVVGESCKASQPGVREGNSSLYSRCWGFAGSTTYSWNAGIDFNYACRKDVEPNIGAFQGQSVNIAFTRAITPTIYNYWKRTTAQSWPGAKFDNLLPDVVDYGMPNRAHRGVNAAFRYEYNCVGWFQQPTYSYTGWAYAGQGGAGFAAAN